MSEFIPVNEPLLDGNEKKYLLQCIDTGWISSEGPFIKEFEEKFANRVGRRHAIAVTNGTAAIDLAIDSLDIGPGDEVILPTFTIISCIQQIIRSGATPVLVDSDPLTWNMDVNQIESRISSRTKAIMVVHIYGLPVDMDAVSEIADRYGINVIEDSAEMHGQTYRGKPCGSFGVMSTFSFYTNKHITTGEGGMIVTNDDKLAETCRSLRNLCFKPGRRFVHDRLGWNMRMTNMQAAIGLAQLERLDEFVEIKRNIGKRYTDMLNGITAFNLPLSHTDYADNIYWVYGLLINSKLDMNAEKAIKILADNGVGARPFFYPMHKQPVLNNMGLFKGEVYPVAEYMSEKGFYIPSGIALKDEQMNRVVDVVKSCFV